LQAWSCRANQSETLDVCSRLGVHQQRLVAVVRSARSGARGENYNYFRQVMIHPRTDINIDMTMTMVEIRRRSLHLALFGDHSKQ
jgi:hypothetical protein